MTVTGCRLGRRNLKVVDSGKMAATFVNIDSNKAVRITSRKDARSKAAAAYPGIEEGEAQMKAYQELPDEDLFTVQEVAVDLKPEDLPGKPIGRTTCASCGENVLDKREVVERGAVFCRPCAGSHAYYTVIAPQRPPVKEAASL
jgi:formylmethanofuran dehydrogenase subunit E